MRQSVLFVNPDYHCSFLLRRELRRMGWRANIFVPESYPAKLLYEHEDLIRMPGKNLAGAGWIRQKWQAAAKFVWLTKLLMQHKYLVFYGGLEALPIYFEGRKKDAPPISLALEMAKILGNKIIQIPSGCRELETKEIFSKLDDGNVCNNCGWGAEVCNDERNVARFDLVRKYADMVVGYGEMNSTQLNVTHFKYKCVDLALWKPGLEIPEEHRLPPTKNLRILHSFLGKGREKGGKNIKGTPYILKAIQRLANEGHAVEHMFLENMDSRVMRYYQAQADIAVEQLIYGWWGSTGIETMALGKPVVCYLRPSWKEFFLRQYPEYSRLPIVGATTQSIYEVLKKLVIDREYREQKARESRAFAVQHFDLQKNVIEFAKQLGHA